MLGTVRSEEQLRDKGFGLLLGQDTFHHTRIEKIGYRNYLKDFVKDILF